MLTTLLRLPEELDLQLTDILFEENLVTVFICTTKPTAGCPSCGLDQQRVHSRYTRLLMDLPCVGVALRLILKARRFFCTNKECARAIFTERLPGLVLPYARRTQRQAAALSSIAFALGGKAGASLTDDLGVQVRPDTLLRFVRKEALPEYATPRVLAIDDFAFRRGHTYGSILIDLERHCIIDLLPDREADSLVAWLKAHPGVEIISRDRAGAYADGARRGAPNAVQVADRFHLLLNLTTAVEHLFERKNSCLKQVVATEQLELAELKEAEMSPPTPSQNPTPTAPAKEVVPTPTQLAQTRRHERRRARYDEVIRLHQKGATQQAIGEVLGLHRDTVRRYINAEEYPEIVRPRGLKRSKLQPYHAYLQQRWAEGQHTVTELTAEIREQGYQGGETIVYDYIDTLRVPSEWMAEYKKSKQQAKRENTKSSPGLYTREAAWLYVSNPCKLKLAQVRRLEKIRGYDEETGQAYQLVQDFRTMVTKRKVAMLGEWLAETKASGITELQSLGKGIERDLAAVRSALELNWSNGQTEGFVNKTKMVKRQMYGRANFDLLRARMIGANKAKRQLPNKPNVAVTELKAVA